MSLKSRKLAVASVAAFAALGASASSSQAAINFNLKATCKYPLVGIQPLDLAIVAEIPTTYPIDTPTPRFQIKATATAGGNTSEAIRNLNAYSVAGESNALSSLKFPSGFVQNVLVPITVDKWSRVGTAIPSPLVLTASGSTPELTFDELGNIDIFVDAIELNLSAYDKAGAPINVKKITTDINGDPFTDSDGDINTFDVSCKLDAGQNLKLSTIVVTNGPVTTDELPSSPGAVTATPAETSVALSWGAATDDKGVAGYDVTVDGKTTRVTGTSTTVSGLAANKDYTASVVAVDTAGQKSAAPATKAFKTTGTVEGPDTIKPSTPGDVAEDPATDIGSDFINVKWGASTDNKAVTGYKIYNEEDVFTVGPDVRNYKLTGLGPDSEYYINITAIDAAGNESEPLEKLLVTKVVGTTPNKLPSSPGAVTVAPGITDATITWGAATDTDGTVKSYEVTVNGKTTTVNAPALTTKVTGLTAASPYTASVVAIDDKGGRSAAPATKAFTTSPIDDGGNTGTTNFKYGLKGTTMLKTLTKGTLPLAGDINADLKIADGTFVADLALKPTQGRLTALGFLPVTASVAFVTSGKTTGLLDDGKLTTKSLVRIKLPSVKLFGAVPLAGGNNCQTKSLSTINLASTNNFDPYKGGNIAGTFAISDLNGCGILNGLVSPLTAGGGNTINLALTYKSST